MMNGKSTDHHQTAGAYSFYLNLIVLDHVVPSLKELDDTEQKEETAADASFDDEDAPSELEMDHEEHQSSVMTTTTTSPGGKGGKKADLLKKSLHGLDQSLRSNMRGLSKRSSQVANKAGAYAARKTMVSRAMQILNKTLPELSAMYNADLTIGKRFSQGKVTVLHVVLKPSAMSRYLAQIKGDEHAATKYSATMSTLEELGATETMKCLEREMLMQVRKGLMEKLSTLLLDKMNEKGNGSLELECIALEEAEEARWLFTFMEFQEQMKS